MDTLASGGTLSASHVIHAVGPTWSGGAAVPHNPKSIVLQKTVTNVLNEAHR